MENAKNPIKSRLTKTFRIMKTITITLYLFSNGKAIKVTTPFDFYPNSKEDGPSIVSFNSKKYAVRENFSQVLKLWKDAIGETEPQELKYMTDRNQRKEKGIVESGNEEGVLLEVIPENPKDMKTWDSKGPFYIIKTKAFYFENDVYRNEFLAHSIDNDDEYEDSEGRIWRLISYK